MEFLKINRDFIEKNKLTISITAYGYYEIKFLERLYEEIGSVISSLEIIEHKMLEDYNTLICGDVELNHYRLRSVVVKCRMIKIQKHDFNLTRPCAKCLANY